MNEGSPEYEYCFQASLRGTKQSFDMCLTPSSKSRCSLSQIGSGRLPRRWNFQTCKKIMSSSQRRSIETQKMCIEI